MSNHSCFRFLNVFSLYLTEVELTVATIARSSVSLQVFKLRLTVHPDKQSNVVPIQAARTWRDYRSNKPLPFR